MKPDFNMDDEKPKSKIYNITFISDYPSKCDEKKESSNTVQQPDQPEAPVPIIKKLAFLYLWIFFLSFGIHCSLYAQSYLIHDENLGIATLITTNATRTLATLLLGYVVWKMPLNWVMLLGSFLQVFNVVASFCPAWYTLIPGAILSGIGSSGIGIAAYVFMATIGKNYERQTNMDGYRLQARIFLLYNVVVQCSILTGYFVSYGVLGSNVVAMTNGTLDDGGGAMDQVCGKDYCGHKLNTPKHGAETDTLAKQYWLCGFCMISIMVSFLVLLFLEPLKSPIVIPAEKRDVNQTRSTNKLTVIQFLLFPGNIITAVGSSFWFLDVTTVSISNSCNYQMLFFFSSLAFRIPRHRCELSL